MGKPASRVVAVRQRSSRIVQFSRLLLSSLIMALDIIIGKLACRYCLAYAIVYFRFPLPRNMIVLHELLEEAHSDSAGPLRFL